MFFENQIEVLKAEHVVDGLGFLSIRVVNLVEFSFFFSFFCAYGRYPVTMMG
jgi:hypothetical protein